MSTANPLDAELTLSDRFAYQAMNGILGFRGTDRKPAVLARHSYEIAAAMLAARGDPKAPASLRDRIAEQAMNGLLSSEGSGMRAQIVARMAYEIADAMLSIRKA